MGSLLQKRQRTQAMRCRKKLVTKSRGLYPTLLANWVVVASGEFSGDGLPDLLQTKAGTSRPFGPDYQPRLHLGAATRLLQAHLRAQPFAEILFQTTDIRIDPLGRRRRLRGDAFRGGGAGALAGPVYRHVVRLGTVPPWRLSASGRT